MGLIAAVVCLLLAAAFWLAEGWRDVEADIDDFQEGIPLPTVSQE